MYGNDGNYNVQNDLGKQIIDIKTTYNLIQMNDSNIFESDIPDINVGLKLNVSNSKSEINRIFHKPMGIIISDTYNNPIFPIRPIPRLDTSKFELPLIKSRFYELYKPLKSNFLPWHYVIDFIKSEYFVFNTRPLDTKFPITNIEFEELIKQNNLNIDHNSKTFIKTKPFDLNTAIHITIVGDSYKDIYTKQIYELIGELCIRPILRYFKLPPIFGTIIWSLNIGNNFKSKLLEPYLK